MRESTVQKGVLDYLKMADNTYFFRSGAGALETKAGGYFKTGKPGCPDIVCCYKGRFIGLEVKAPKKNQSKYQIKAQQEIEDNGGLYFVVRSVQDIKQIMKKLEETL